MAFLMSYVANRKDQCPLEVIYNTSRAYHYLGMNTYAQKLYEELITKAERLQSKNHQLAREIQQTGHVDKHPHVHNNNKHLS